MTCGIMQSQDTIKACVETWHSHSLQLFYFNVYALRSAFI